MRQFCFLQISEMLPWSAQAWVFGKVLWRTAKVLPDFIRQNTMETI
jgi:hypothetical protein